MRSFCSNIILQTFLIEEEVKKVSESLGYVDTARKFTLYDLIKFFIAAAANGYKSYRHGIENMELVGLAYVDYLTISKKAADVNYEICKTLFEIIVSKCNRQIRRILKLPKQLIAVDSTTVTVGENRLKWAKFKGKKSGIKLHVIRRLLNNRLEIEVYISINLFLNNIKNKLIV